MNYHDPIASLTRLVAFESVSNRPIISLCEWVADACAAFGFRCDLERDPHDPQKANVIARIGPQIPGGLIVSGHLDVVPTQGQPWTSNPFALTERDGKLYGRGTSDMKGFVAATLASFSSLNLKEIKKPLVLLFTYDEEIGCKGSAQFARTHAMLPDWFPKEALIGEPTDMRILRMHPGHVTFRITVTGKAAHSSKPDLGQSAIKAAAKVVVLLEALEAELAREHRLAEHLERPYVTLNIGLIQGGQAVNIVPDHVEMVVGYRPLPGDDPRQVFERFQVMLKNSAIEAQCELQTITPAMLTKEGTQLQSLIAPHAHGSHTGAAAFATDGGNLQSLGISSLIFGPGSIDVAHKADEYIARDALISAPKVISDIIRKRCMA